MTVQTAPQTRSKKKQIGLALLLLAAIGIFMAPQIPDLVMPLWVTEACWQETAFVDEGFAVETAVPACWLVK